MARPISVIKAKMLADIQADPVLSSILTSPSLTAIYNLWCYIFASATNLFEQVQDLYIANAESAALKTPPATPIWIQNQVFNYQYDPSGATATNVVVIKPDFSVGYGTKNTAFNIVTLCSVKTSPNNYVEIKAAQGDAVTGYSAITGTALAQLDGFLGEILPAGINHTLISQDADYLGIIGTVYFRNGFSGVIMANVLAAIKAYADSISISNTNASQSVNYTGVVKAAAIEEAIISVDGVSDIRLTRITARSFSTPFASSAVIYDLATGVNNRQYNTAAGYIIQETGANSWANTLIFSAAT
jgi:hypothetical protein